jgi:putative component of membrane protein insertase Oxa1/YidC/SpoIIIJ protein YidD
MVFKLLVLVFSFITLHGNGPGYFPPWGKDSDLMFYEEEPSLPKRDDPLSIAAEKVILFHQNVISPVDGPRSHFRPTSARYMLLAMRRYGFFIGYLKGCDRLLRENKDPWIYRTRTINNVIYKWDPTYG